MEKFLVFAAIGLVLGTPIWLVIWFVLRDRKRARKGAPPAENIPAWQKAFLFFLAAGGIFSAAAFVINAFSDSPEAQKMKGEMQTIAEKYDDAVKVGDRLAVLSLVDSAVKTRAYYESLAASRPDIEETPLRYCGLAANHLISIVAGAALGQEGSSPSQYREALSRCK